MYRKMATSTRLSDLPDNFFMCSVCLKQLVEPKQLQCLHRYCSDCLKTVIKASHDSTIKCPLCKQECDTLENGIADFKSDLHMKGMLEFKQMQAAFDNKALKQCVSCLEQKHVSAYCFKCSDILCEQCYTVHVSSKMFTDHQPHTLTLDDTEAKNLTLETLASMKEDPRCHMHPIKEAHLCCSTCGNVPVCVNCTYNKHNDHELHCATELAKTEIELLKPKLAELNIHKGKVYELPKKIEAITRQLDENTAIKTEQLINQHKEQYDKIKDKLVKCKSLRETGLTDIEKTRNDEDSKIKITFEDEMRQLKQKLDDDRKLNHERYENESQQFEKRCDKVEKELNRKLKKLDVNLKNLISAKEQLTKHNKDRLNEISNYLEQIMKRYENFTATTSSMLAAKDDWTDVQCVPDVRAACEPLIAEMKQEFKELESLSDIPVDDISKFIIDDVTITKSEEFAVDVEGFEGKRWWIDGIASSRDGDVVITGSISDECSHITVINRQGKIQRQDQIQTADNKYDSCPYRYCCHLSEFKVATIYHPDEIGIYDVRDGTYNKKNISDVINCCLTDRHVSCVATDPENNHIIVGTNSGDVYVFDDQLKYSHTITLPDVINGSTDIAVHEGSLLVCDSIGKKTCYAVSLEGPTSKLMYELTRPDLDGGPISVCIDGNSFIYMLWRAGSVQFRHVLVQYSQDGRRLLRTRNVDDDARTCVTIPDTEVTEKLLIATFKTGKLYAFGLVST